MKILLFAFVFLYASQCSAQGQRDFRFELRNDANEIEEVLDSIASLYSLDQSAIESVEEFIRDRLDRFPMKAATILPDVAFDVVLQQSVGIQMRSSDDFNIILTHLNMTTLKESERTFVGNSYRYTHPRFSIIELNIIAVTHLNVVDFSQPEKVYFIITDMDRL